MSGSFWQTLFSHPETAVFVMVVLVVVIPVIASAC